MTFKINKYLSKAKYFVMHFHNYKNHQQNCTCIFQSLVDPRKWAISRWMLPLHVMISKSKKCLNSWEVDCGSTSYRDQMIPTPIFSTWFLHLSYPDIFGQWMRNNQNSILQGSFYLTFPKAFISWKINITENIKK